MSNRIDTPPRNILDNTPTLTPDRWSVWARAIAALDDDGDMIGGIVEVEVHPSSEGSPGEHWHLIGERDTRAEAEQLAEEELERWRLRLSGQG
jgi:hypothetical protein